MCNSINKLNALDIIEDDKAFDEECAFIEKCATKRLLHDCEVQAKKVEMFDVIADELYNYTLGRGGYVHEETKALLARIEKLQRGELS